MSGRLSGCIMLCFRISKRCRTEQFLYLTITISLIWTTYQLSDFARSSASPDFNSIHLAPARSGDCPSNIPQTFEANQYKPHSHHIPKELRDGVTICRRTRRPNPKDIVSRHGGLWQYANSTSVRYGNGQHFRASLALYSAFYDDRVLLGSETWLRVIGIVSIRNRTLPEGLHCRIWYEDYPAPFITPVMLNWTGRESGYHFLAPPRTVYGQVLFSCRLPGALPRPNHVSITTSSECAEKITTFILVNNQPTRVAPTHELGICVPIAYGHVPPASFIEWIEMYRILGVTEFNVYDSNMFNMSAVFEHYTRMGVLRVHNMPPPVDNATGLNGVKVASAAALNDCLLTNVYRYNLVIVVDFDEFILPRSHKTFLDMLDDIDRAETRRGQKLERREQYFFRNVFFFKDFGVDQEQSSYLTIARYVMRPASLRFVALGKSFIDPRMCLVVWNHSCLRSFPGSHLSVAVNSGIAIMHHYRRCNFSLERCKTLMTNRTRDESALRFKGTLQARVDAVLEKLHISVGLTTE